MDDREKALKQKDLEIDKKLLEKNREVEDYKTRLSLMNKQLSELPESLRRRDQIGVCIGQKVDHQQGGRNNE